MTDDTETMLPRRAGGCEWTMVAARVPSFTGAEAGVAQSDITVVQDGISVGGGDIFQVVVTVITTLSLWTLVILDKKIDRYMGHSTHKVIDVFKNPTHFKKCFRFWFGLVWFGLELFGLEPNNYRGVWAYNLSCKFLGS